MRSCAMILKPFIFAPISSLKCLSLLPLCHRMYSSDVSKDNSYPASYDPYGPRPPPSEKISQLAARIVSLSAEEMLQLGPTLHRRLKHLKLENIASSAGLETIMVSEKIEEVKVEKTTFDVKLETFDVAAKIRVIKEVRAFTSLGLKEAKELVEKAPVVVLKGVSKEEAIGIVEKIKAAGGGAVME